MSLADAPDEVGPFLLGPTDESDLQELLRAIFLDSADALLVLDRAGIILAANPAASGLFDRPLDVLVGSALGHPVTESQSEIEIWTPSGEIRHVDLHVGATSWRGDPAQVVTLRNVTDRRRADQALRDYVSMTAHEIATPLTSISGFAETLETAWDELDDQKRRHFASIIGRQAMRVSRISRDLLELSRVDADAAHRSPEPVSYASSIRELLDEGAIVISDAEVTVDIAEDVIAWADPSHVSTILRNLLSNAVKYGEAPFRVVGFRDGDHAVVEVHNAGNPVPEEFVPQLFVRFARSTGDGTVRREGTGLGLALSDSLAELNRGVLDHRPGEPDGAVFVLRLPGTRTRKA